MFDKVKRIQISVYVHSLMTNAVLIESETAQEN